MDAQKKTPKCEKSKISSKTLLAVGMFAKLPADKQEAILKAMRSIVKNG